MVPLAPVLDAANLAQMLVRFNRLVVGTRDAAETAHLRENCVICGQHVSGSVCFRRAHACTRCAMKRVLDS